MLFLLLLCVPVLIHGKYLHFMLFSLFMVFTLHMQPYAVHFIKQHWQYPCSLRPIRLHLFYRIRFFLVYVFPQTLYHVPHTQPWALILRPQVRLIFPQIIQLQVNVCRIMQLNMNQKSTLARRIYSMIWRKWNTSISLNYLNSPGYRRPGKFEKNIDLYF